MHTGSKEQQDYEKNRRYGAYKTALKEFNGTTCKSAILSVSESYYKARLNTWSTMRKEMRRRCINQEFVTDLHHFERRTVHYHTFPKKSFKMLKLKH